MATNFESKLRAAPAIGEAGSSRFALSVARVVSATQRKSVPTGVLVLTKTGHHVKVFPFTDSESGLVFYPMRPAYATTLMKVQGDTLDHMTLYLDVPGIEAAG